MRSTAAVAPALLMFLLSAAASAQGTTSVAATFGLAGQSGARMTRDKMHSPVGPAVGLAIRHTTARGLEVEGNGLVSVFPQIAGTRTMLVGGVTYDRSDPSGSLSLATVTADVSSPLVAGFSWFGCAGAVTTISTTRPGNRTAPVACLGLRRRVYGHAEVRASYQQFLVRVGETRFQIPLVFAAPIGRSDGGGQR